MRSLLDVNVLIALLDADHSLHQTAMSWFSRHGSEGWASCPITQNGCVRILSHPGYPHALPVRQIVERLSAATKDPVHEFWPDDISLLNSRLFDCDRIHGPRQLSEVYLLALAVMHKGRLVTFDGAITPDAVRGAKSQHLVKL